MRHSSWAQPRIEILSVVERYVKGKADRERLTGKAKLGGLIERRRRDRID